MMKAQSIMFPLIVLFVEKGNNGRFVLILMLSYYRHWRVTLGWNLRNLLYTIEVIKLSDALNDLKNKLFHRELLV
jgi:hypothetical protein